MKLLHLTFHFEYAEEIQAIMDHHEVTELVRYPQIEGRDRDGKHFGTQAFPGNISVVQAQVAEEKIESLCGNLQRFREEKQAHQHLQALFLPIERTL